MAGDDLLNQLRRLVGGPRDGALLRVSIANSLVAKGEHTAAIAELRHAVEFDPDYSAAWKLLGKALIDAGDTTAAIEAYRAGISAASQHGDIQAQKEMTVFLRRLERAG
ncbi:MAG: tetratricopeptide repeat protein [Rudaea sp.]